MMEWENKLYQILLKEQEAEAVVDDWVERNIQSDLRLRRAKTKGHVVIETRDVMFARNIQVWHPSCQINIKDFEVMEKKEEKKVCCICGKEYEGYGYNPFPVKEEGCCCQSCNYSVVVPERWERHKAFQRGEATGAGKVYISGAIAHYDMDERKEAFSRAEEELKAQGYDPVNPFRNGLPDEAHWRAHMRADIALLLACDYIYMLKDWELSKGAKLELDVASSCGIKVLV